MLRLATIALMLTSFAPMLHAQKLAIGSAAPTFRSGDHLGKTVHFPTKGSWAVLAFYPKAGTPG